MQRLVRILQLVVIFQFAVSTSATFAQLDSSTSLLLPSGRSNDDEEDSGSDRYTIRKPKAAPVSKPAVSPAAKPSSKLPAKTTVTKTIKVETSGATVVIDKKAVTEKPAEKVNAQPAPTLAAPAPVESAEIAEPKKEENYKFEDKIENLVLGAGQNQWEDYREKLPEEDSRNNILEFSISPFFLYNDSTSPFWPRQYNTFGTGYEFQASVWVSPFFALNANYKSSVGQQIKAEYADTRFVAVQNEWLDIGIRSRRFFDQAKEKTFLTFGIDFRDYQFKVPHDEPQRISLESSGARLTIEGQRLVKNYATTFGFGVMPFVEHKETAKDPLLRSGGKSKGESFELNFGGRWYFDRHNQVFWKVTHIFESNRFTGESKMADPKTGAVIEGVSVTNTWSLFQMGYSWGD